MRCSLLCLALLGAASAGKLGDLTRVLNNDHEDVSKIHELSEELSRELEKEDAELDPQELAALSAAYSASHPGNVTWKSSPIFKENAEIESLLFEGDLKLTPEQLKAALDVDPATRRRRQAVSAATYMWPKGSDGQVTIAWDTHAQYPRENVPALEAAMRFWEQETCIRFRRATANDKQKITFLSAGGCWSEVGMIPGRGQQISIADGCTSLGTVAHEISHAFGTLHVQSRQDRDRYVRIVENLIQKGTEHNFAKEPQSYDQHLNLQMYDIPYEYGSVMHYGNDAFSTTGAPTILATQSQYQDHMGGPLPTFYDVMLVNKMYKCYDKCGSRQMACKNGGIVNVNTCNTCKCPKGWEGADCGTQVRGEKIVLDNASKRSVNVVAKMGTFDNAGLNVRLTQQEGSYYIIEAPAGRRVQFSTNWEDRSAGAWAPGMTGCGYAGLEVISSQRDPRSSGFRVCNPRLPQRIVSDGNTMIIHKYRSNSAFIIPFTVSVV